METLCQFYLGILSTYHVASGVLSFFFGRQALRFYKAFYGTDPVEQEHLLLILKPWGALSIAIGIAGWHAALDPREHVGTVLAILVLLLLRLIYRIRCRTELLRLSRVTMARNAANLALLGSGALILTVWLVAGGGR